MIISIIYICIYIYKNKNDRDKKREKALKSFVYLRAENLFCLKLQKYRKIFSRNHVSFVRESMIK